MSHHEYTIAFPFGGAGGGALGALQAEGRLFGHTARFRCLGGFDIDAGACADFHYLTGTPQLCADARGLTVERLREVFGPAAPDVICGSPPCQASSKLISNAKAKEAKYEALNELALVWTRLMLEAWKPGPKLVIFENVPGITARAKVMLDEVRRLLIEAGYVIHDGAHELGDMATVGGPYDAGELGGLAQRRKRWLLVARDPKRCPPFLYKPPKRRVRGVGEVLGPMPMPGDPAGGRMHELPRISTLNWLRLALIPAGGDWRDLPGVLAERQQRRAVFRRMHLESWDQPSVTIGGPGTNGPYGVADPRAKGFKGVLGVVPWTANAGTVTCETWPLNGAFSVAQPLVSAAFDRGYSVLGWNEASPTVAGGSMPGQGAYSVADPRCPVPGAIGFIPLAEAEKMLEGSGPWAIVDPQSDGPPVAIIHDLRKPPPMPLVIVAEDGTWHRPLTTLELAVLQGLPWRLRDAPLELAGTSSTEWRRRIGNMIPAAAMQAIGTQMLITLLAGDLGTFHLSSGGGVWVDREQTAGWLQ